MDGGLRLAGRNRGGDFWRGVGIFGFSFGHGVVGGGDFLLLFYGDMGLLAQGLA